MKKKLNLSALLFCLSFTVLTAQTSYFYYYKGERQYLELDTRYVFVSITDSNENRANRFVSNNVNRSPLRADITKGIQSQIIHKRFWTELSFENGLSDEAYLVKLSEIRRIEPDAIVAPYFKNEHHDKIGLSNFFCVKLKSLNDTVLLKQKAENEQAIIVYQDLFMPLLFTLSITQNSNYNAMEMASRFQESGLFQYSTPDLMIELKLTSCAKDPLFKDQWGLRNIGQSGGKSGIDIKICDAWQLSTGRGVVVAPVGEGVWKEHPDLSANIHSESYNLSSLAYSSHGTAVAGIIGAERNNGKGIAGVAPNCALMSVHVGSNVSPTIVANSINWAMNNGADVINISWSTLANDVIESAINNVVANGRDGKGCVVVASSGNDNSSVSFPAKLSNVIAVGAVNHNGRRWNPFINNGQGKGSNYGSKLDMVAPGVDIQTTNKNPNSNDIYTSQFTGTSAAAPHVSGVAALILSVRPDLTQDQVRNAIESTAQKVNSKNFFGNNRYTYSTTSDRPYGTWNDEMGYGLINAHAAVLSVLPHIFGPDQICTSAIYTVENNSNNFQVLSWSITPNDVFSVTPSADKSTTTVTLNTCNLNGQFGTLTAMVNINGIPTPITKNIQVCDASNTRIEGPSTLNANPRPYYIANIPWELESDRIRWNSNINGNVTVSASYGRTVNAYATSAKAGSGIIYAYIPVMGCSDINLEKTINTSAGGGSNPSCNGSCGGQCSSCITGLNMWDYLITKNPIDKELQVHIVSRSSCVGDSSGDSPMEPMDNSEVNISFKLLDNTGVTHRRTNHRRRRNRETTSVEFDVSNLREGTYYLHIEANGELEQHQIIITK